MSRYHLVSYDAADKATRDIYDDYLRTTGAITVPIWLQSLGADTNLLEAYWTRTKGSLQRGRLPLLLKEMVIFVVSVHNGARYCSAAHAHAVLNLDKTLTYEALSSLTEPASQTASLPPSHRAALDYAIAVAQNANEVPDELFDRLVEADFTDAEIHELQSVIDLSMMFNAYTSAFQLPLDPEYRPVLEPVAA
ncbi:MAG: carboxymuconolactone decarboxylase family protein [Acidimicrobiales bacterium]